MLAAALFLKLLSSILFTYSKFTSKLCFLVFCDWVIWWMGCKMSFKCGVWKRPPINITVCYLLPCTYLFSFTWGTITVLNKVVHHCGLDSPSFLVLNCKFYFSPSCCSPAGPELTLCFLQQCFREDTDKPTLLCNSVVMLTKHHAAVEDLHPSLFLCLQSVRWRRPALMRPFLYFWLLWNSGNRWPDKTRLRNKCFEGGRRDTFHVSWGSDELVGFGPTTFVLDTKILLLHILFFCL